MTGIPQEYSFRRYLAAKQSLDDRSLNRHVREALAGSLLERRATKLWHLVPYFAAGTVLTLIELALAAQMHSFALSAVPR